MDRDGLLLKIFDSVERINQGRKWQNTIGLESNGRATYNSEINQYGFSSKCLY